MSINSETHKLENFPKVRNGKLNELFDLIKDGDMIGFVEKDAKTFFTAIKSPPYIYCTDLVNGFNVTLWKDRDINIILIPKYFFEIALEYYRPMIEYAVALKHGYDERKDPYAHYHPEENEE